MEKIKFIADTASDIPDEDLLEYGIDMPSVPIAVEGKEYFERRSFSLLEFYDVLTGAKEIPTTSRVPVEDFYTCYKKAHQEGYTHVFCVTINAGGSGTHTSAQQAKAYFLKEHPDAAMAITVVDSRTYAAGYGYPVVQGARMAREGRSAAEIEAYLTDFFDSVEIYLGCYSLEYAKRSGRIGAATAFVGDVLGLRPVILMVDGQTKTIDKVRGDKNLPGRIFAAYKENCADSTVPPIVVRGSEEGPAQELADMLREESGMEPLTYYAGGSIIINAGPRIIAVVVKGKNRRRG